MVAHGTGKGGKDVPKAAYATLGCKVNAYETEAIARLFAEEGYARVPFGEGEEDVELVVVNTCAVTHAAEKRAASSSAARFASTRGRSSS